MSGKDKTVQLPRVIGSILQLGGFAEAEEPSPAPVQDVTAAKINQSHEQPTIPGVRQQSSASSPTPINDESTRIINERFAKDLVYVLEATPENFHQYLETKQNMMEAMQDAISREGLEVAAIKAAIKHTKLTEDDVKAAMSAARGSLTKLSHDFEQELKSARLEQVGRPQKEIADTEKEIDERRQQIVILNGEIHNLEASISPKQKEIESAQENLREGEQIFRRSSEMVQNTITRTEQQLLNLIKGKGGKGHGQSH